MNTSNMNPIQRELMDIILKAGCVTTQQVKEVLERFFDFKGENIVYRLLGILQSRGAIQWINDRSIVVSGAHQFDSTCGLSRVSIENFRICLTYAKTKEDIKCILHGDGYFEKTFFADSHCYKIVHLSSQSLYKATAAQQAFNEEYSKHNRHLKSDLSNEWSYTTIFAISPGENIDYILDGIAYLELTMPHLFFCFTNTDAAMDFEYDIYGETMS